MLQFGIIPTAEFLCLITNHATDAIKTVVHTVNVKFRKLKNNVRNTNKTKQLDARIVLHRHSRRCAVSGSRTKEVLWK